MEKKNITISLDPRLLEMFQNYCDKYEIENRSEFIEKIIAKKISER